MSNNFLQNFNSLKTKNMYLPNLLIFLFDKLATIPLKK